MTMRPGYYKRQSTRPMKIMKPSYERPSFRAGGGAMSEDYYFYYHLLYRGPACFTALGSPRNLLSTAAFTVSHVSTEYLFDALFWRRV